MNRGKPKVLGKDTRSLFEIGRSLAITIPKEYIEAHGLKPGDIVDIYFDDFLRIEPVKKEQILKKFRAET